MVEYLTMVITMQITMFMVVGLSRLALKRVEANKKAKTEEAAKTYSRLF